MTKALLYSRVSSLDREGDRLESQLAICRKYCMDRGYEIVGELSEDQRGVSGAKTDPQELTRALEMARNDLYNVLVVRELDRLSRDVVKLLILERQLKSYGVRIEYALQQFSDDPEGRLNMQLHAMIAEFEKSLVTQRLSRGRLDKAKAGSPLTHGHPPYAYSSQRDEHGKWSLVVNEREAEIVRLIFRMYTVDKMSINKVTRELTRLGVPTRTGRPKWNRGMVYHILGNRTYLGTFTYGLHGLRAGTTTADELVAVPVPRLIDDDTFKVAQEMMQKNKETNPRNRKGQYLLSRRVRCGACGRAMVGITRKGKTAAGSPKLEAKYRCPARRSPSTFSSKCTAPDFPVKSTDTVVWDYLRGVLLEPDKLAQGLAEYDDRSSIDTEPVRARLGVVETLLAEHEKRLQRVIDLYVNGDIERELLVQRKDDLQKLVSDLQTERDELQMTLTQREDTQRDIETLVEFASAVGDGLAEADLDFQKRREIVEMLNVRVTLTAGEGQKTALVTWALDEVALDITAQKSSDSRALVTRTARLVVWDSEKQY